MPAPTQPTGDAPTAFDMVQRILVEGETHEAVEDLPIEYRHLDHQLKRQEIELKRVYANQEIQLRRNYARGLLLILAVQIVVADVVFWVFAEAGKRWRLSDGVIQIWLAAAVVEVIGVVTVVTRHLFPRRDGLGKPDGSFSQTSEPHDTVGR